MIVCLFIIIVLHPPEFECIDLPLGILATSNAGLLRRRSRRQPKNAATGNSHLQTA
jgi:hypothetical protein